jgi:hypothetical protein
MYQKLYPARGSECADYKSAPVREINKEEVEDPQTGVVVLERLIPHICDFVVEYINSDVVVCPTAGITHYTKYTIQFIYHAGTCIHEAFNQGRYA